MADGYRCQPTARSQDAAKGGARRFQKGAALLLFCFFLVPRPDGRAALLLFVEKNQPYQSHKTGSISDWHTADSDMSSSPSPAPVEPQDQTEQSPLLSRKPPVNFPSVEVTPDAPATTVDTKPPVSPAPTPSKFKELETPVLGNLPKADTNLSWGAPAGLHIRNANDENLRIFRRAVGINSDYSTSSSGGSLEEGRKAAMGVYKAVISEQKRKSRQHFALSFLVYFAHFAQIVIGAILTALGPDAGSHTFAITALGAVNTVMAGLLALVKGQGLPERLRKDEMEFRRLQDWIEETEALLTVGVIGKNRKEAGLLVEVAFKKYNAAKQSEENNLPDNYVSQIPENVASSRGRSSDESSRDPPSLSDRR
ncbi:hypothetical protein GQ53DRAFT_768750 [Thozetella sp. PMI_491]|nr:hypothetical protein GQ53DRAFT_768750 [Thozetella sp. PMI_491]